MRTRGNIQAGRKEGRNSNEKCNIMEEKDWEEEDEKKKRRRRR